MSRVDSCSFDVCSKGLAGASLDDSSFGISVPSVGGSASVLTADVDAEPSDAMLTFVVVASAGSDLVDAPAFFVS